MDMCMDTWVEMRIDMSIDVYANIRIGVCMDLCIDMCVDMCIDMGMGMCIDMCIDVCIDMCVGMGMDMCTDMCIDMCIDKRTAIRWACATRHWKALVEVNRRSVGVFMAVRRTCRQRCHVRSRYAAMARLKKKIGASPCMVASSQLPCS